MRASLVQIERHDRYERQQPLDEGLGLGSLRPATNAVHAVEGKPKR